MLSLSPRKCLLFAFSSISLLSAVVNVTHAAEQAGKPAINPNFFYLLNGELVGERKIILGDPKNYYIPLNGREGMTESKKLKVAPIDVNKEKGVALGLDWNGKKMVGNFSISGPAMDLSKIKDAAALTIDMRIDSKPEKPVKVTMSCDYPCGAEVVINANIKSMKKGEWFTLPIPLNCFKSDNFDLSKITSPFGISTDGKFKMAVTSVRLEKLAEGDKGCAGTEEKK